MAAATAPSLRMQGTLFKYGKESAATAFQTGDHSRHVLLIGGLTDGLMPTSYTAPLSQALDEDGWSLVQVLLSSSYGGYGTSSLDRDASELASLARYLQSEQGSTSLILVGHSTGCQDIARLAQQVGMGKEAGLVLNGAILQAPVSDNEYAATLDKTDRYVAMATEMVDAGAGEEMMPRDADPCAPVCARRFLSLSAAGGDDDYFSTSLSDNRLRELLGHMANMPTLLMLSGEDEYVPPSYDAHVQGERLARAIGPSSRSVVVEGANHSLEGQESVIVDAIVSFLRGLTLFDLM